MTTIERVDAVPEVRTARLQVDGRELDLPIEAAVDGQDAINISSLLKDAQLTTLDYGYANTAPTRSAITFLDGDAGILRYRGYPIEELAEQATFLETAWLLVSGELPTAAQLDAWTEEIRRHTLLREEFRHFFDAFPMDAHPMAILGSAVSALSTFYQDGGTSTTRRRRGLDRPPDREAADDRGRGPQEVDRPALIYPDNTLDYEANFLRMMLRCRASRTRSTRTPCRPDLLLIVHADHEQNCTTSTVRMVGSSDANLFASIAAGISPLGSRCTAVPTRRPWRCSRRLNFADGGDVQKAVMPGEGPRRPVPADGLRPPRVQEPRPAGPDDQGRGRATPQADPPRRPPAAHCDGSSSRWRSQRPLLGPSTSCIRTSGACPAA